MTVNCYERKKSDYYSKKLSVLLLVLILSVLFPQLVLATECPELNSKLKDVLLDNTNYRIASLNTFNHNTQEKILVKTNNHCPDLIKLDSSVEAFAILLQDKTTNHYHVFHAVKCSCKGGPPWRVAKITEISDDIPIIRSVTNEIYLDSLTSNKIQIESTWKTLSIELLNSGDKYLYKRKKRGSKRYVLRQKTSNALRVDMEKDKFYVKR